MSGIFSVVRTAVIMLLIVTALIQILPDNQYLKYIKFFSGLLLIVIFMRPLSAFLNIDNLENFDLPEEIAEMAQEENFVDEKETNNLLLESSTLEIKQVVIQMVSQYGYTAQNVDADVELSDDGTVVVNEMTITLTKGEDEVASSIQIDKIDAGGSSNDSTDAEKENDTKAAEDESLEELKTVLKKYYSLSEEQLSIQIE